MMNKIYLNELSLEGQFDSMEDFLAAAEPFLKCLKFIRVNQGQVNKHSTFYQVHITKDKTWNDLRGLRGDTVRRLKSLLLSTTDNPPFWDTQAELKQDLCAVYKHEDQDVSATSIAEAAEDEGILISIVHPRYQDTKLAIHKNDQQVLPVPSVVTPGYLAEQLWTRQKIDLYTYLNRHYEGTRLDFSTLERKYAFDDFEFSEIQDCLESFERFVKLESWEMVYQDSALCYKPYSPSSEHKDWFIADRYSGMNIYKFRCVNPKRCFGYREHDTFHVLRMERDHKISDNG